MCYDIHTFSTTSKRVIRSINESKGALRFADTDAARMLRGRLDRQKAEGVSLRTLAKKMGYTPAVLSHMATGRVGIPLERATSIADAIGLDSRLFLAAVVDQRARGALRLLAAPPDNVSHLSSEIKAITGVHLDGLNDEQKAVIREVAADPSPRRRWLSIAELPAVMCLRQARPSMATEGLPSSELNLLAAVMDLP